MKQTPKAPHQDTPPPRGESRRQLTLFVETFPRRRPIYDPSVLLQVLYELRTRQWKPKPLAKTSENPRITDEQLDIFGGCSK